MLEVSLTHVLSFYVLEYKKIGRDCEFMKVIGLVRVNTFVFGGAVVKFFSFFVKRKVFLRIL